MPDRTHPSWGWGPRVDLDGIGRRCTDRNMNPSKCYWLVCILLAAQAVTAQWGPSVVDTDTGKVGKYDCLYALVLLLLFPSDPGKAD